MTQIIPRQEIETWIDRQSYGLDYLMDPQLPLPSGLSTEVVFFRHGECRKERQRLGLEDDNGQLLGTAHRDPNGVWWWFPRHKKSTSGKRHRGVVPLESTGGLFPELDQDNFDLPIGLECRVPRHDPTPRLRAWLRSRAESALADGYTVVHI